LMQALKAARDAINLRPSTSGHFLFIGTGSHRSLARVYWPSADSEA
jgi:hypothetical protein